MQVLITEDMPETQRWLQQIVTTAFPNAYTDLSSHVQQSIKYCTQRSYTLALIDLGLPDGSGLEILNYLHRHHPNTQCVVVSAMGDDEHIVAALAAGADGYLMKEQATDLIIHQLKQLTDGTPALSPSIARRLMTHFSSTRIPSSPSDSLTDREKQVLCCISQGLRNTEVARQLEIAESTVATHIKSIYHKLGISSRAEAASYATHFGLTGAYQHSK